MPASLYSATSVYSTPFYTARVAQVLFFFSARALNQYLIDQLINDKLIRINQDNLPADRVLVSY